MKPILVFFISTAVAFCFTASVLADDEEINNYEIALRKSIKESTSYLKIEQLRGDLIGQSFRISKDVLDLPEAARKKLTDSKWHWAVERKIWAEGDYLIIFISGNKPIAAIVVPYGSSPTGNGCFGVNFRIEGERLLISRIITNKGKRLIIPDLRNLLKMVV
jgi:hypothetical protein